MVCGICKADKQESFFSFKDKAIGRRHTTCKNCHKVHASNYYNKNKKACAKRSYLRNRKHLESVRVYMLEFFKGKSCVDCGESDPVVFEFDHIDPTTKSNNVSVLIQSYNSIETIKNEIAKCEIRCANCHKRKTAKDQKWYKYIAG